MSGNALCNASHFASSIHATSSIGVKVVEGGALAPFPRTLESIRLLINKDAHAHSWKYPVFTMDFTDP